MDKPFALSLVFMTQWVYGNTADNQLPPEMCFPPNRLVNRGDFRPYPPHTVYHWCRFQKRCRLLLAEIGIAETLIA